MTSSEILKKETFLGQKYRRMEASVLKRITDGGLGRSPQPLGYFCKFLEKKYLNPIGSHFARVQKHFKELDF